MRARRDLAQVNVEDIPHEYKAIMDVAAGVKHSDNGKVMRALAEILTLHEKRPAELPTYLLQATDPAAPFALLAYASASHRKGADDAAVADIKRLAMEFYRWQDTHGVIPLGKSMMVNDKIDRMFRSTDGE